MSAFGQVRAWVRAVAFRRRAEREMQEEMAAHIAQAAARYVARGMSETDALSAARREFGNAADLQEQSRDSRGGRWVEQTLSDVRYALRYFARTPLTTLTIVLTLTLGIGVNTAAFGLYQGMRLRPPPGVPDDPSLVAIKGSQQFIGKNGGVLTNIRPFSFRELSTYQADGTFSQVAGWLRREGSLDVGDANAEVKVVSVAYVTPNYFSTVGVSLSVGAGFVSRGFSDVSAIELTAVLEHRFAVEQFGMPANAMGKRLRINDQILTVVGVAPPRFTGIPARTGKPGVWVPVSAHRVMEPLHETFATNDSGNFLAVARLAPGKTIAGASLVADGIGKRFTNAEATWPDHRNTGARVIPVRGLVDVPSPSQQKDELLGSIAIAALDLVILLVCTTTVSSLLIGAAVARRHEIGVRLALGASRARIVRQLLTESVLLALAGGIGGLIVFALVSQGTTQIMEIDINPSWGAAAFTTLLAMATAIICGLSPALHATKLGLSSTLKESSNTATSRTRLQRTFVVAQIALAQPLLVCLAMFSVFILGEYNRYRVDEDIGDHLIKAQFDFLVARQVVRNRNSIEDVRLQLEGRPGIVGVTASGAGRWIAPMEFPAGTASPVEMQRSKNVELQALSVSANYFQVMDIPIMSGNAAALDEVRDGPTPVVVGATLARTLFGESNAIGREFCINACEKRVGLFRVVAVAAEKKLGSLDGSEGRLQVYMSMKGAFYSTLLIRTRGPAREIIPAVRSIAKVAAPKLPLLSLETVADMNRKTLDMMVQISRAIAGGGITTLLLGCVGLYAVVALGVGHRRREIGVRIALGARPGQVVSMFFRSGLRLSIIGLAIGLPLSAAILRILATQVGFPPTNMLRITVAIAVIVVAVAALATWLPARRAAGVDPLAALRMQ
ncbi:MAG: ABC transporter permease [Phycisphaerae bacterium]|nr:ABC transporter permease [Gemmatimonadaceae bacterium]